MVDLTQWQKNLVSSGISTGIAELATIPICTVKTMYQTNVCNSNIYNTIQHIYKNYGVLGFCRAGVPAMSGQIMTTMGKYTLYKYFGTYNPKYYVFNGLAASFIVSLFSHPFDWFRVTLQRNESIRANLQSHGLKVIYRGYSKSVIKNIISSIFFYPFYEYLKNNIHISDNERFNIIFSSGVAAFTSTTLMQPIDYIKTKHIAGQKWYQGIHNPALYYKGLSLNLFRVVPHFIITMNFIEYFKSIL
jgi:hypothetical protein